MDTVRAADPGNITGESAGDDAAEGVPPVGGDDEMVHFILDPFGNFEESGGVIQTTMRTDPPRAVRALAKRS